MRTMKHILLIAIFSLAPLPPALHATQDRPIPAPAPLVEPTQRATIAMQALYEHHRMFAQLFAFWPDFADYFDAKADAVAEVYELLFGVKIPEVRPGVQS